MKYFLLIFSIVFFFLASCTTILKSSPKEAIVDISQGDIHIGYGVMIDDSHIMTATHVYSECQKITCRYRDIYGDSLVLSALLPDISGDRVILSYTEKKREKLKFADLSSNMSVFTLTSYSGSWQRKEGKIIALDRAYIGYDTLLSGTLFTGAIETDLVLEKGESGLPLWSLSGDLVGVMSASDHAGKRGYIVR